MLWLIACIFFLEVIGLGVSTWNQWFILRLEYRYNTNFSITRVDKKYKYTTLVWFTDTSDTAGCFLLCMSNLSSLRKIPKFNLTSWCGNFAGKLSFRRVYGDSTETLRKLYFTKNFHTIKFGELFAFCTVLVTAWIIIQSIQNVSLFTPMRKLLGKKIWLEQLTWTFQQQNLTRKLWVLFN